MADEISMSGIAPSLSKSIVANDVVRVKRAISNVVIESLAE